MIFFFLFSSDLPGPPRASPRFGEQHSKGHLDNKDPASVASFLRAQADRLDKTEVRTSFLRFCALMVWAFFSYLLLLVHQQQRRCKLLGTGSDTECES